MKIITVFALAALLSSCGPTSKPVTVNPPTTATPAGVSSPNQKLILSLDAVLIACEAAAPNTSPAVEAWIIPGCPNAVESVISALSASSTPAQVQIAVAGIQTFLANAPKNGLSQKDSQIIQSVLGATNAFLLIYQQQAVASVTTTYAGGFSFLPSHKAGLTAADKSRLKELRKRAEALKKRKR